VDGNKRVGFAVVDVFLRINGYAITAESTAIYDSMMKLFEQRTFDLEHLVPWMQEIVEHARHPSGLMSIRAHTPIAR
jgi:death-on-curing protein